MKEQIESLLNQEVEFFDARSGTVLDVRGNSKIDWWEQGKILITKVDKKYFFGLDINTGERAGHRYNKIKKIEGKEIYFL